MGEPKQKWTAEEEAALKAGIGKHRARKWCTILKDPEFRNILRYRSNVDLKDKYRNMNVTVNASGSRDKVRTMVTTMPTAKKPRSTPKQESHSTAITTITSDGHDDVVDVKPIIKPIVTFTTGNKSLSRLENIILEAVKTLNEPTRSYKTSVANSSEQYWPRADFDHVLSAKLNELTSSWKLMKAVTFLSTRPEEVEQRANIHLHLPPSGWTAPCSEHGEPNYPLI
ncbi:single myb histone 6-like [Hordeum vulgare subsp. vulgare]|uniref:single myb histone 6-like n=1 Tax=Hordeum vulgare subsp. vulgare TaxID=112509 RepID=UPI001D1A483C|nr:single myb histone 6-like [Hordeum vulgare subsp. vulgare]